MAKRLDRARTVTLSRQRITHRSAYKLPIRRRREKKEVTKSGSNLLATLRQMPQVVTQAKTEQNNPPSYQDAIP